MHLTFFLFIYDNKTYEYVDFFNHHSQCERSAEKLILHADIAIILPAELKIQNNKVFSLQTLSQPKQSFVLIAVKEIYKSGENPATSNYRPISFLPSFIKILENIVECQLQTHLSENILLTNVQFGFRKGKGTDQKMLFIQFFSFFIIFIIIIFFH